MAERQDLAPVLAQVPAFYHRYLLALPDGDILDILRRQLGEVRDTFLGLPAEKHERAYAPGKWTPKDMLQHITDTERVFQYRILRFGRGDATPLPGFEEDDYAAAAGANRHTMAQLVEEFEVVRRSSLHLIESLSAEARQFSAKANGNPMQVEGMIWILAGHPMHHIAVLRERY